jgi:plasmid stabilization system protein ParE
VSTASEIDFSVRFALQPTPPQRPKVGTPTRTDDGGEVLERKVSTPRFPYVVVYRTTDSDVEILAVHHERRRPYYWADRATE